MKSGVRSRKRASPPVSRQGLGKSAEATWDPPVPPGYPASIQSLGGFAAPLLAAASFTMTALLLPTLSSVPQSFARWPDAALTLFVASGLAQIATVQAAMWARRYDTFPEELAHWYPDEVLDGRPTEWLRAFQHNNLELSKRWANRTRFAYHVGILLLLGGLAVTVVPAGHMTVSRWVLVTTACLGLVGELSWVVGALFLDPSLRHMALYHTALMLLSALAFSLAVTANSLTVRLLVLVPAGLLAVARLGPVFGEAAPCWSRPIAHQRRPLDRFRVPAHVFVAIGVITASVMFVFAEPNAWVRFALAGIAAVSLAAEAVQVFRLVKVEQASS